MYFSILIHVNVVSIKNRKLNFGQLMISLHLDYYSCLRGYFTLPLR